MRSLFKALLKKALAPENNKKLSRLDITILVVGMCAIYMAIASVVIYREYDSVSSSPIITGNIFSVKYLSYARAVHRVATIEFPISKASPQVCKLEAGFDLSDQKIAPGETIRMFKPDTQCKVSIFPDDMKPLWEPLVFSAICFVVAGILAWYRRYRDRSRQADVFL